MLEEEETGKRSMRRYYKLHMREVCMRECIMRTVCKEGEIEKGRSCEF